MPSLSEMSSPDFWKQAAEGAVVTGAATLAAELAVYHTDEIKKLGLTGLPWDEMGSVAVVAALLSVLTALGKKNGPKVRALFAAKPKAAVDAQAAHVVAAPDPLAEEVKAEVDAKVDAKAEVETAVAEKKDDEGDAKAPESKD